MNPGESADYELKVTMKVESEAPLPSGIIHMHIEVSNSHTLKPSHALS